MHEKSIQYGKGQETSKTNQREASLGVVNGGNYIIIANLFCI